MRTIQSGRMLQTNILLILCIILQTVTCTNNSSNNTDLDDVDGIFSRKGSKKNTPTKKEVKQETPHSPGFIFKPAFQHVTTESKQAPLAQEEEDLTLGSKEIVSQKSRIESVSQSVSHSVSNSVKSEVKEPDNDNKRLKLVFGIMAIAIG
eukprot:GAHX01000819.1.p1 GENE.GAHX01000819.1~~GAHX01000819.1.p1  ORF type:complete len:150 (-),score=28.75 GAHX01000819.1:139-588(-)